MRIPLVAVLAVALQAAATAEAARAADTSSFPTRPVRIVVPQAPGGASDALARITGQRLTAINPALPAKDVAELVTYAKANPGKLNYGSAGNGSVNHLLGIMFNKGAGVQLVHVPYKGAAPALSDLMGGIIQAVFTSMPSVVGLVQAGRVRALAVTSAKRSATLPSLPTISESAIKGFDVNPWFGLLAPARTPPALIERMNRDIAALIRTKEVSDAFSAQGAEPFITTPEAFHQMLKRDIDKWAVVVKESGARVD